MKLCIKERSESSVELVHSETTQFSESNLGNRTKV